MIITPKFPYEQNREYALRIVKDNIINLELKPGRLIGEQEIASMLNLSRTPVHEAFLELSKSKIVNILPQKGCLVSYIEPDLVNEARFLRQHIESALIEEACKIATDDDIAEIEEVLKLQEFYLTNYDKFLQLDNDFHKCFYKICNKMQCHYMVTLMSMHFDRVRNLTLHENRSDKVLAEHKLIFDAVKKRDSQTAVSHFVQHIKRIDLDWDIISEKYGEFFSTNIANS